MREVEQYNLKAFISLSLSLQYAYVLYINQLNYIAKRIVFYLNFAFNYFLCVLHAKKMNTSVEMFDF